MPMTSGDIRTVGVLILIGIILLGWVISVGIRSWRGHDVPIVIEGGGMAAVVRMIWRKLMSPGNGGTSKGE